MRPLILQPQVDMQADLDETSPSVSSRIGLHAKALQFGAGDNLYLHVSREIETGRNVHCVLIDEAQFLSKEQVWQLSDVVDDLDVPVLAYGLRTDFRGEPFPGSMYLLAWAEEISEIKTVCRTGRKATMNARLDAQGNQVLEGEQIDIGHHYIALSRPEFNLPAVTPIQYKPPVDV